MTTIHSSSSSTTNPSSDQITLTTKRHTLEKETELRIEVGENNPAYIKVCIDDYYSCCLTNEKQILDFLFFSNVLIVYDISLSFSLL